MKRRWKILGGLLVLSAIGALIAVFTHRDEPQYQGRTVTAWLDDWATHKRGVNYYDAIKAMGTNALPYAIKNLAQNDSWSHKQYGSLQPKLPRFLQKILPASKPLLQVVDGANVFGSIGTNSVPYGIALLKHESPTIRQAAAEGLGALRRQYSDVGQSLPALVSALNDPDRLVRFYAAMSLKEWGAEASNAVPALIDVASRLLELMRDCPGYIFNLGHGVPPNAKLESIEALVNTVRSFK